MSTISTFLPMVIILVIFYLILIVPDRKRRKQYDEMLKTLRINDEVTTKGGLVGKIFKIEDDYVIVQSGPDKGTKLKVSKSGIAFVTRGEEEEVKPPKIDKADKSNKEYKEIE